MMRISVSRSVVWSLLRCGIIAATAFLFYAQAAVTAARAQYPDALSLEYRADASSKKYERAQFLPTIKTPSDRLVCPSLDITTFIAVYAENSSVQRQYTSFPLQYTYVDMSDDPADPYKDRSIVISSYNDIPTLNHQNGAIFPYQRERDAEKLAYAIDKLTDAKALVTLFQPDTDYLLLYLFELEGSCWFLKSIENKSL